MPHVIIKAWPGKTEEKKQELADAVTRDVMEIFGYGPDSVSVSIVEVESKDWKSKVFDPDIKSGARNLYKKPGYSM